MTHNAADSAKHVANQSQPQFRAKIDTIRGYNAFRQLGQGNLAREVLSVAADPFNLRRFVAAQEPVYDQVLAEIRSRRKRTHWMWFVFPQLDGLGSSSTAKFYAIKNVEEAQAYLNHAVLGPRLRECIHALLATDGRSASEIFGYPDDLKLHSCATLFAALPNTDPIFDRLLIKYFHGARDQRTLDLLSNS